MGLVRRAVGSSGYRASQIMSVPFIHRGYCISSSALEKEKEINSKVC